MAYLKIFGYDFKYWSNEQVRAMIDDSVECGMHGFDSDGNEVFFNGGTPQEFKEFIYKYCDDPSGGGSRGNFWDDFNEYAREHGIKEYHH